MSAIARLMARKLWGAMLWLMRRPFMRTLQRISLQIIPSSRRAGARRNLIRQNRWARRYGLTILIVTLNVVLASMLVTYSYVGALKLYETGALGPPVEARH